MIAAGAVPPVSYLYVASDLRHAARFADEALAETSERHHLVIAPPAPTPVADLSSEMSRADAAGVVVELCSGLPSREQLQLLGKVRRSGRRAWIYWPREETVECVDDERLASLDRLVTGVKWLARTCVPIDRATEAWRRMPAGLRWIYRGEFPVGRSDLHSRLSLLTIRAQPIPMPVLVERDGRAIVEGTGLYLRTDYWNGAPADDHVRQTIAGLASITARVVCLLPHRDATLDAMPVEQVMMDPPRRADGEDAMVFAATHFLPIVKAACRVLGPAYLYDHGAVGESVGAELSQQLGLPYVVDYRGAGAMVREALGAAAPFYPEIYALTEELALRQASIVVVSSGELKDELVARGIDAARVVVAPCGSLAQAFEAWSDGQRQRAAGVASIDTGDAYKDRVQDQWNQNPIGSQHVRESQPHTLDWFREVERHRYGVYAPWMPGVMEFTAHADHDVLEIGGGIGTDLAQFAMHGARVTDLDLAAGHLRLAEENFRLRGLNGTFIHHDAESLPFPDATFDLVYSNGVLHHTPNTATVVGEIHRVLRPGGRAIVMLYAENSYHYWRKLVWQIGMKGRQLDAASMGEIMSRQVERSANEARPLVKVYTRRRAEALFQAFERVEIVQRQLQREELPGGLQWALPYLERRFGWNLIVKASKRHGNGSRG
jgi:ubiquinone/menaquinone biosynthesis C-methylase UbiE